MTHWCETLHWVALKETPSSPSPPSISVSPWEQPQLNHLDWWMHLNHPSHDWDASISIEMHLSIEMVLTWDASISIEMYPSIETILTWDVSISIEMHPSIEMVLTWRAFISIQMDAGTRPLASFDSSEWVMSHTNAPDVIHVSYRRVSSEWVKRSKRLIRMSQMMWVVTLVVSRDSRCEPWFVSMSPVWDQWVVVGLHCKRHPSEIDADTRPFVCHPIQSWMMESGGSFRYTSCRGGGYIQPSPFARSDNFMERCRQSVSQLDRIIIEI